MVLVAEAQQLKAKLMLKGMAQGQVEAEFLTSGRRVLFSLSEMGEGSELLSVCLLCGRALFVGGGEQSPSLRTQVLACITSFAARTSVVTLVETTTRGPMPASPRSASPAMGVNPAGLSPRSPLWIDDPDEEDPLPQELDLDCGIKQSIARCVATSPQRYSGAFVSQVSVANASYSVHFYFRASLPGLTDLFLILSGAPFWPPSILQLLGPKAARSQGSGKPP